MNRFKLNLFIFAAILTTGLANAKPGNEHAILRQSGDDQITITAKADLEHPLTFELRNENGDLVFADVISGNKTVRKTYDLRQTKIGRYQVAVYCNDKNFPSTFIGEKEVEVKEQHILIVD